MTTRRRMGVENAKNRTLFVEATEQVLREEGYPAVTARKVAGRAGLKTQLLYYYFETMDDLILAVVRKVTENRLDRFEQALRSPQPLWAMWELHSDPAGAVLSTEMHALASHREKIRAEIVRAAKHFRALQIEAVSRLLAGYGVDQLAYPAAGIVTITAALARTLVTDTAVGVPDGYAEAVMLVERALEQLEGSRVPEAEDAVEDGVEAGALADQSTVA